MKPGMTTISLCAFLFASFCLAQPDEATSLYNRGVTFLGAGKPFDALEAFTQAIARKPGFAEAYCGQGDAYSRTSRYPLAIISYTEAIKIKPGYADALCGRGFAHYFAEEYVSSQDDFAASIKADVTKTDTIVGFLFGELATLRGMLTGNE